ncbi:MAG: hypothetical protein II938_02640 [Alphaproteobacteria bacterium]|nr:hypothetical protein [Alphaproteobacteria bacterium]
MKYFFVLFLLLCLPLRAEFLAGTDVPLMDGLIVNENDTVSFDTPSGQILSLTAQTSASKKEILNFYHESLLALGWQQKSQQKYRRDQDELILQVIPTKLKTIVKLQLTFANK